MLTLITLIYLALPYFIFAWGWLWWPYATLLTAILLLALGSAWKHVRARGGDDAASESWFRWKEGWLVLLVTLVLLIPAGVGGIGSQRDDWRKHNAIVHDLSANTWPVVLETKEDGTPSYYLTYYIAYYLPAAAVGRIFGVIPAHLTLFVWTLAGLLLCARWVSRLTGAWAPLVWLIWFALNGLDVICGALTTGYFGDWWAEYWQYSANFTLLMWVPQHMLPGWLATAVIMYETERRDLPLVAFCGALTGLWSPFVTIGLVPLGVVLALRGRWRTIWTFANLVAAPAVALVAVLYLASIEKEQIPEGFIFNLKPWTTVAVRWPLFCMGEFGLYAVLIAPFVFRRKQSSDGRELLTRDWFLLVVATLVILPIYSVGKYNDLCMRASIPCLFLFWIVLLRVIFSGDVRIESWRGKVLFGCLLIATAFPVKNWLYQVAHSEPRLHYCLYKPDIKVMDLEDEIVHQYLGRANKFFYRYLGPSPPRPDSLSDNQPVTLPDLGRESIIANEALKSKGHGNAN